MHAPIGLWFSGASSNEFLNNSQISKFLNNSHPLSRDSDSHTQMNTL